ncbi:MAG: Tim44/TimA family putative adaptor protein [Alphaproteobacteria bacterium]
MANIPFLDILFLAMIAGFVLFRLYNVLGRRTGHERRTDDLSRVPDRAPPKEAESMRAAARVSGAEQPASGPVARALLEIKLVDRSFDAAVFLAGARGAYEIVVTAFAQGDSAALRPLLSDDVFATFEPAIRAREEKKHRVEFKFSGIHGARITGAALTGRIAEVTVTFDSEFVMATYDEGGALVDGSPGIPHTVTDIWTFARDTRSKDPNWTLIATASGG